jgi:transcription antitermination factor NusG
MQPAPHSGASQNNTTSNDWYAAYVKHQHERKAASLLERKGIEVFLPLQKTTRQWKDRSKSIAAPLFPGYLFIFCNLKEKLTILNTPGIFFLVESGGRACAIPSQEIESLRTAVEKGAHAQPHPFVSAGDRVRVTTGPLSGITGILTRFKNQYRVVLGVELLQKAVSIEVDLSDVEHIKSQIPGPDTAPRAFAQAAHKQRSR